MPEGKNMFEIMWTEMDSMFLEWQTGLNGDHPNWSEERKWELRGEMKGLAFAIKNFSFPFLQEDRAVSKLANQRFEHYISGSEMPNTPGVDGYSPLPPAGVRLRRGSAFKRPDPLLGVPKMTITQVKKGLEAGFMVSDLVAIYKITPEQVEACR